MLERIATSTLILAVALLLWAVFELRYQRDFWREHYCFEVLNTTPEHVCAENYDARY